MNLGLDDRGGRGGVDRGGGGEGHGGGRGVEGRGGGRGGEGRGGGRGGGDRGRGGGGHGGGRGGEGRGGGRGGGDRAGDQEVLFAGVRFKLVGFKPEVENKYKMELERRGAIHSLFYGLDSGCTHLIVEAYTVPENHKWCKKGREGNAVVINQMWLDHCVLKGQLVQAERGMYMPSVDGGIPGALTLGICCSGYGPEQYEHIRMMVYLMGGSFLDNWSYLVTYAVCFRFEGSTYEQAKTNGSKIVNERWLEDCLDSWKIMPSDNYCIPGEKLETFSRILDPAYVVSADRSSISLGFRTPTEKSAKSLDRTCKSTGNKRPRSNMASNPKCLRCLLYVPDRSCPIDKYLKSEDLVISVQYPFERRPKKLTNHVMKRILLKAYVRVCHLNNDEKSLAGSYGCKNFVITDPNETVELCDVTVVDLTPTNREADKTTFVNMVKSMFHNESPPADVRGWLQNISDGWQDALLLQHIYMVDPENTWAQFWTLYYCLGNLEKNNSEKYKTFLEAMSLHKDWYRDGFKWTTLNENRQYQDQRDTRLARYESKREGQERDPHRLTAHGALKAIKNTWSHPAKAYQEFFLAILLRESEELLSTFQKAMYDSGFYGKNLTIKHFL